MKENKQKKGDVFVSPLLRLCADGVLVSWASPAKQRQQTTEKKNPREEEKRAESCVF
jgi:hypothetical protein